MANYRETLNLRQMKPNLKLSNPSWSLQGAGSLQEWTPNFPFFPLLMFNLEKYTKPPWEYNMHQVDK